MMREAAEERILIQRAAEGDTESFEALILSCKDKAYGIALRYLKNEEDAMDAVQESFIKIYKGLPNFNFESRFDTWVYRIVTNASVSYTHLDVYKRQHNKGFEVVNFVPTTCRWYDKGAILERCRGNGTPAKVRIKEPGLCASVFFV